MEITPQVGIGRLMLGMRRSEALAAMPGLRDNSRTVHKLIMFSDISVADGVELDYIDDGTEEENLYVIAINVFAPASPRLFGRPVLGISFDDAWNLLESLDPEAYVEDGCVISSMHGIELKVHPGEDEDSPDARIERVCLFDPSDDQV